MKKFIDHIISKIDFHNFDIIFCGLSGGCDSVALLLIIKELSKIYNFKVKVIHFDHNIRTDSHEDLKWCKIFCSKLNTEFLSFKFNFSLETGNLENTARNSRLKTWKHLITKYSNKKCVVALAHHLDDKIENFFLRLMRGSNSSGATSLRYHQSVDNINIIRPLLDYSKIELEQLLLSNNISDWRLDKSNFNTKYKRNFLRHKLLPDIYNNISYSRKGIIKAYNNITLDSDCLESIAYNILLKFKLNKIIDLNQIKDTHIAIFIRVIKYWISNELKYDFIPKSNFLLLIVNIFNRIKNGELINNLKISIDAKRFILLNYNKLSIVTIDKPLKLTNVNWNWKSNSAINFYNYFSIIARIINNQNIKKSDIINNDKKFVFFDLDKISNVLLLKQWNYGDKMTTFGSTNVVSIKKLFHNYKISIPDRYRIPILTDKDGDILWLCGIRRSSKANISDSTKLILSLNIEEL